MSIKDKFKKWRNGEEVEAGLSIDFTSPKLWLLLLIIALFVLWLVK